MFFSMFYLNTQVPLDLLAESPITSGITFFSSFSLSAFSDFFFFCNAIYCFYNKKKDYFNFKKANEGKAMFDPFNSDI